MFKKVNSFSIIKKEPFDKSYYHTDSYDDYLQVYEQEAVKLRDDLVKNIAKEKISKILDVGCGMGGVIRAFRDIGIRTYGTEISGYCLRRSPSKKYMIKASVLNIPYQDDTFDLVICADVFCYLEKKDAISAISELCRISKRYIYFETIYKGSFNSSQKINPDPLRKDKNLWEKEDIIKTFENFGFQIKKVLYKSKISDFNAIFERKNKKS